VIPRKPSKETTSDNSLNNPYSCATLIKVLLDTPENIWRAIEAEDYLSAARLEALGRVVYSELESTKAQIEEDDSTDLFQAFPLIEKQREGLRQLGLQVARRVKASLQQPFPSSFLAAQALVALFLLENTPSQEALDLFFSQRTVTLDSLAAVEETSKVEEVVSGASRILRLILATLEESMAVWAGGPQSLLSVIMDQIQNGPNEQLDASLRIDKILQMLPSSHSLLRYLPASVIDFTPFLEPTSREALSMSQIEQTQQTWLEKATQTYTACFTRLCEQLDQAQQLVTVRQALDALLASHQTPAAQQQLQSLSQNVLLDRFNLVISRSFDALLAAAQASLQTSLDKLATSTADLQPASFLFSSSSDSVASTSKLPSATRSIGQFAKDVNRRLISRSPLLDTCLCSLEQGATRLHSDLAPWLEADVRSSESSPALIFSHHFEGFCDRLIEVLEGLSEEAKQDGVSLQGCERTV
jgi:hypothetical protein